MKVQKQNGLTLLGFIIVLSIVLFVSFIGMKIVPIYMEYYAVVSAMNGVAAERGAAKRLPDSIRTEIRDRLYVSYSSGNVQNKHMKVTRRDGVQLRITYEVRKPIMGNLDVVAKFDRSVTLAN
jgi:hypothetical protein